MCLYFWLYCMSRSWFGLWPHISHVNHLVQNVSNVRSNKRLSVIVELSRCVSCRCQRESLAFGLLVSLWLGDDLSFSVCSCDFRCNEPANSYFTWPEANRGKEGVGFVPLGHLSSSSFSICPYRLSSWDVARLPVSLEKDVPFPNRLN